jgi:hypothetical protein
MDPSGRPVAVGEIVVEAEELVKAESEVERNPLHSPWASLHVLKAHWASVVQDAWK